MKERVGAILHPAQERYLERLQPPRDALLSEMERVAAEEGIPISDPEVGRLLQVLAVATGARSILELGTAIGYGTVLLARSAPEALVVSVDRDGAMLERARGYLDRAGVGERVELVQGEVLEVLDRLNRPFDLVYVDAEKVQYRHYLDRVLDLMPVGGTMVFDNLLWKGLVGDPPDDEDDRVADAVRAFNPYMMIHPQLVAQIVPIGDGVGIATKRNPTMREMGGPF